MFSHRLIRFLAIAGLVGAALPLGLAGPVAAIGGSVVYDAIPSPLPPNVASVSFQATQTSMFGDYVHLAGTDRLLSSVTITMSDWALYADYSTDGRYSGNSSTWTHPITVSVYSNHLDVNGVPDTLLATVTKSTTIPWRPAEDPTNCPTKSAPGYDYKWQATPGAADTNCYNGYAFNATFDFSSLNVTLPGDVIVAVAYNTQTYGAAPIGSAGPYNSLNVANPTGQTPSVGTDDSADNVFSNTGGGTFQQHTGWAPNGTVAMRIETIPPAPPTISKSFSPTSISINGSSTLSFTITNPNSTVALTGVGVSDTLPAGLVIRTPSGKTGSCGGGTISAVAGSSTVSLTGATLATGASCTFSVNVTGQSAGVYVNTTDPVTSTNGGTGLTASATLNVLSPDLAITSSHTGNFRVNQPGTYTLHVSNVGGGSNGGLVTVTDTLPAGLPPVSVSGSGWTCSIRVVLVTCTRSSGLAAGSNYPDITLVVRPTIFGLGTFVNMARVSGDNDANPANNLSLDHTVTGF